MEIEFFGAAGEVTGSCHILRVAGRALLIDCGLIQGGGNAAARNRERFPFDPVEIDAVFLTHAHLDHSGRLPLLYKQGFRGPIYTTAASRDLLPVLLYDSADLAAREVERINRRREPGEPPATALYDREDVAQCLGQVKALRYDTDYAPFPGVSLCLREAGHILGSSSLQLDLQEGALRRRVVFSGDLGQYDSPILHDPHRFSSADLVVMECTYGDRLHRERDATLQELAGIIAEAAATRGNIVMPSFAVGRSQELLYLLGKHYDDWQLAPWKIFLDSPMAIEASKIYWRHVDRHDDEAQQLRASVAAMPALPNFMATRSVEESRAINAHRSFALIIAGSGMCNGGRVLHHLARNLPRRECHVIIAGYQAPGTLGRSLVDGAERVNIYGEEVAVRAALHTVGGLSAHADQRDLLRWYDSFENRPPVCLVHGEPEPLAAFKRELAVRNIRGWAPGRGDIIDILAATTSTTNVR